MAMCRTLKASPQASCRPPPHGQGFKGLKPPPAERQASPKRQADNALLNSDQLWEPFRDTD